MFVDATRVGGATVVAAYSPRVRPGVPVSFPLAWDELDDVTPSDFTIHTALDALGDRDPVGRAHARTAAPRRRPDRRGPRDPRRPGAGHARGQAAQAGPRELTASAGVAAESGRIRDTVRECRKPSLKPWSNPSPASCGLRSTPVTAGPRSNTPCSARSSSVFLGRADLDVEALAPLAPDAAGGGGARPGHAPPGAGDDGAARVVSPSPHRGSGGAGRGVRGGVGGARARAHGDPRADQRGRRAGAGRLHAVQRRDHGRHRRAVAGRRWRPRQGPSRPRARGAAACDARPPRGLARLGVRRVLSSATTSPTRATTPTRPRCSSRTT